MEKRQKAEENGCLGFQDFCDVAAREVRNPLKVAALCLGSAYLCRQGARKVAEEQVLARHWQPQQPVQESPVPRERPLLLMCGAAEGVSAMLDPTKQ